MVCLCGPSCRNRNAGRLSAISNHSLPLESLHTENPHGVGDNPGSVDEAVSCVVPPPVDTISLKGWGLTDQIELTTLGCVQCGRSWHPCRPQKPKRCPNPTCRSMCWDATKYRSS